MLLAIRPLAVSTAVLCFFAVGLVGAAVGLSPGTCCKRAVLGAGITYLVTCVAVRAISAILTHAMIADQIGKGYPGDHQDERHP